MPAAWLPTNQTLCILPHSFDLRNEVCSKRSVIAQPWELSCDTLLDVKDTELVLSYKDTAGLRIGIELIGDEDTTLIEDRLRVERYNIL